MEKALYLNKRYYYYYLKHDQVGFRSSFQVFIRRINLSRTMECFKIDIVLVEIAVNVLIGCLYIHRYAGLYIQYSPGDYTRCPKKSISFEMKPLLEVNALLLC